MSRLGASYHTNQGFIKALETNPLFATGQNRVAKYLAAIAKWVLAKVQRTYTLYNV
jgi:hypothetical protein